MRFHGSLQTPVGLASSLLGERKMESLLQRSHHIRKSKITGAVIFITKYSSLFRVSSSGFTFKCSSPNSELLLRAPLVANNDGESLHPTCLSFYHASLPSSMHSSLMFSKWHALQTFADLRGQVLPLNDNHYKAHDNVPVPNGNDLS